MKHISTNNFLKLLQLLSRTERFVFLDTSKPDSGNCQSLLFMNPVARLQCYRNTDPCHFLDQLHQYMGQGYYLAGWIGYEFGYLLEEGLRPLLSRPGDQENVLADLAVFEKPFYFNHQSGEHNLPLSDSEPPVDLDYRITGIRLSQEHGDYLEKIEKIKDYIRAGDTYQVNYTLKLLFAHTGSTAGLYSELRRNQSVSYGAYMRWDDEETLCFSPELFFAKKDGKIIVKPMKGTMARGRTLDEDMAQRDFLRLDPKNRSENVMIVDLLRNDLSNLMHKLNGGGVVVDSLFDVEVYETLLQMTSTIKGEVVASAVADIPLDWLFKSLFPCGSVTGAPKIRTMEIIDELEQDRRGVYTGAIGYLAPNGDATFNVPIRTVVKNGSKAEMGIGSGIVYDSDPESEWQECLLKGGFLVRPNQEFVLIETLLWEAEAGYWLLADHLERLHTSAEYFLFDFDRPRLLAKLNEAVQSFAKQQARVRLTLAKDGQVNISLAPCDGPAVRRLPEKPEQNCPDLPLIELSRERVDCSSPHLFHKSSKRQLFDREFERAGQRGLFDICFLNKEDKLTEGCITNIFLYKDGSYVTPPVSSGLLAGVMRKQLLGDKERLVREEELTEEDVINARAIFLCNSVRGVVRVRLAAVRK